MTTNREFPVRGKRLLAGLAGVAFLAMAGSAAARPVIPGELQSDLHMPCAPPCTICHQTLAGGRGTATKPFAGSMLNKGFTVDPPPGKTQEQVTQDALDQMTTAHVDSDFDGIDDVTELKEGTDPNNPDKGANLCGPVYGCVRVAPGRVDGVGGVVSAMTLLAGIALMRRRRR